MKRQNMQVVYLPPAALTKEQREAMFAETTDPQFQPATIEELRTILMRPSTNAGLVSRMAQDADAVMHFVALETIRASEYAPDVLQDVLDKSTTCHSLCHDLATHGCKFSTATIVILMQAIGEVYGDLLTFAGAQNRPLGQVA
jgi:hypothetical protein